jgi:hypothetical protein
LQTVEAGAQSGPTAASLRDRLRTTTDWHELFGEIDQMTSVPPSERALYKAVILETCSMKDAAAQMDNALAASAGTGTLAQLEEYVKGLMRSDQQKQALDYTLKHRIVVACSGFAEPISNESVEAAYASAAALGSPTAQARVIAAALARSAIRNADDVPPRYASYTAGTSVPAGFPDPLTPEQQGQLVNAVLSGDPVAIRTAGRLLSQGSDQQSFRFGPDHADPGSMNPDELWTLVACQFGFECGTQNMEVVMACAERSQCAPDYPSYLRDYVLTPAQFAALQDYAQAIADALQRHDASAFQIVNQPGHNRTLVSGATRVTIH